MNRSPSKSIEPGKQAQNPPGRGLTAELSEFVAALRYTDLPGDLLPLVRDAFTDTVGVIMVGVDEPVVRIVREEVLQPEGRWEARACLSALRVYSPDAALLGGTAAHAHDYDDQSLSGHPSAVLVPAILAEGEVSGSTGKDMVTAYVAGYEVWAELVRRDSNYHRKGWHPTAVFGTIGAAAAVASLRRLAPERVGAALAIAGSHAGGLGANFGTMTKPYHAGLAARNGALAARLAARGMTAGKDAFETAQGFLTAFSFGNAPDRSSPSRLGEEWFLPRQRLCVKKYPTCYFMHRSFDATARLVAEHRLRPEDIRRVEVTMGKGQTAVLLNERPQTGLEAKFSEQFAIATAVVRGTMGVADLTDEVVQRPEIQAFFPKVRINAVDEYDPRDPAHSPTERVVITLQNGSTLDSGVIAHIRGHAYDPLGVEELWQKFADCTARTHSPSEARALFDLLQGVERLAAPLDLPTCTRVFENALA